MTQHSIVIGGVPVAYTATAGTLIVCNYKDEPWASMGYVAYVKKDAGGAARRPITFAFNGGPGSSSVWLHMGALGPRRVVTADAAPTPPPPYQVVDNAYSILDKSDLVMIDPVGTGLSKAVGDAKDKDFWGGEPDIDSISRFIRQYVSDTGRWNSPKYVLGESYDQRGLPASSTSCKERAWLSTASSSCRSPWISRRSSTTPETTSRIR